MNQWIWKRTLAVVAGLSIGSASPLMAQVGESDFAGRSQALQVVAMQRFEIAIRSAIAEADRLKATSPEQAVARLKEVQYQLDADTILPPNTRREMTQKLQARIASIRNAPAANANPMGTAANGAAPGGVPVMGQRSPAAQVSEYAAQVAQVQRIADSLAEIDRLATAGKLIDAETQAAALAEQFPDAPPAQAMLNRQSLARRLKEAKELLAEYEKRIIQANKEIVKSALPAKGDVEFPEDWKEKTARRKQEVLTAKEKEIMRALDSQVELNYRETSFSEALQDLSDRLGQPIIIDKAALADAAVDNSAPVTAKLSKVSGRTALRKILSDMGLTYVIKNEVIYVTSTVRAREMLVTRVYYIGDLVQATGPFGGAVTWGPFVDQMQTQENLKVILQAIEQSIDPMSWKGNGGLGSIQFHMPTMSLIVRQTTEVHSLLQSKLGR
ncbi:DUF4974 domain-containing protein [Tuwongella immobilis]|uniref:Protein containing Type II and III secretion system domain protein n=1 Tax=Tuwongella immobilis TaxID=692036 RepID=A0A6C2YU44_9BACT|nr:DUF4974 domain-containing protein [Tuwongella immobilis]VIP04653.1 Protein containing Type II and III secretion system domain protein OS=Rhodopirellula baltica SH28 GN=RBSH_02606 PE=4 SV=1 [Tuwongella immobilis]VTS06667.1 Protein containing Type II and III secretion system domain protein OS=Rhodopirellula baltica SH28 GN=RBSH_02606 PE=4 SV=1 [Tuwongella immobilis]